MHVHRYNCLGKLKVENLPLIDRNLIKYSIRQIIKCITHHWKFNLSLSIIQDLNNIIYLYFCFKTANNIISLLYFSFKSNSDITKIFLFSFRLRPVEMTFNLRKYTHTHTHIDSTLSTVKTKNSLELILLTWWFSTSLHSITIVLLCCSINILQKWPTVFSRGDCAAIKPHLFWYPYKE